MLLSEATDLTLTVFLKSKTHEMGYFQQVLY